MRLSLLLLASSAAGILGGAWLCGPLAFGIGVMAVSLGVGVYAWLREFEDRSAPTVTGVPTLHDVLERARSS